MVFTSKPKVSVVVPSYNHARFLAQRLESILGQTFQDFELILLDDCSTDDSRSILLHYADDPRVGIEFNEVNSGSPFKQWNKGVRLAHGEYVWIAESDDYADEKLLERLVTVLDSEPQVVFANCRSWRVDADDRLDGYVDSDLLTEDREKWTNDFNVEGREECRNTFVYLNPVFNASSVLFRKAVYERVGGADESLRFCGDWKLWAAMSLTGRVAHIGDPLNYYRVHDASVTAKSQPESQAAAEYLRVIRWILRQVTPTKAARRKLSQTLPWFWAPTVTTGKMPLQRRWSILRDAIAIDPRTVLHVISVELKALARVSLRKWRSMRASTKSGQDEKC
jgi:glycosyltransferase involved in cell wall biosynthesis